MAIPETKLTQEFSSQMLNTLNLELSTAITEWLYRAKSEEQLEFYKNILLQAVPFLAEEVESDWSEAELEENDGDMSKL